MPLTENTGGYIPQNGDYTVGVTIPVGTGSNATTIEARIDLLPGSSFATEDQMDQAAQILVDLLSASAKTTTLWASKNKRVPYIITPTGSGSPGSGNGNSGGGKK